MPNHTTRPWEDASRVAKTYANIRENEKHKNQDRINDRSIDLKYFEISDRSRIATNKDSLTVQESVIGIPISNPDGLDSQIRGKYADALKTEPLLLTARAWGVHPAKLTMAIKAKGMGFVLKEIGFVDKNRNVKSKAGYLSRLLLQ